MSARLDPEWRALVAALMDDAFTRWGEAPDSSPLQRNAWRVMNAAGDLLAADRKERIAAGIEWSCTRCGGSAGTTSDELNAHLESCRGAAPASSTPADPAGEDELGDLLNDLSYARGENDVPGMEQAEQRIREHVQRRVAAALNRSVP